MHFPARHRFDDETEDMNAKPPADLVAGEKLDSLHCPSF